ncbi:hypothetical protein U14_04250 [Candidatus Moduliflexus flocculans]|uniref:Uncharacterized protein n=1 Tax=Candidatus Moduliflexus flocculans TaxID=1499966 RepID=A0A0S6W3M6_9BACT|nr:hypothetical protein U14_04250 [Candidatus Moduliflexus flocculans]
MSVPNLVRKVSYIKLCLNSQTSEVLKTSEVSG